MDGWAISIVYASSVHLISFFYGVLSGDSQLDQCLVHHLKDTLPDQASTSATSPNSCIPDIFSKHLGAIINSEYVVKNPLQWFPVCTGGINSHCFFLKWRKREKYDLYRTMRMPSKSSQEAGYPKTVKKANNTGLFLIRWQKGCDCQFWHHVEGVAFAWQQWDGRWAGSDSERSHRNCVLHLNPWKEEERWGDYLL